MKPTIGRIVHYVDPTTNCHCAAIVTMVLNDTMINLKVFGPHDTEWRALASIESNDHLPYTWHWPER